jgi:hypothetical protein
LQPIDLSSDLHVAFSEPISCGFSFTLRSTWMLAIQPVRFLDGFLQPLDAQRDREGERHHSAHSLIRWIAVASRLLLFGVAADREPHVALVDGTESFRDPSRRLSGAEDERW